MVMRFHWGLAVGHVYSHQASAGPSNAGEGVNIDLTDNEDEEDDRAMSSDNLTETSSRDDESSDGSESGGSDRSEIGGSDRSEIGGSDRSESEQEWHDEDIWV
jgi:hypothetical protein